MHRWAADVVRSRRHELLRRDKSHPSNDDELLEWYAAGWPQLVHALENSAAHEEFWYWGPAPNAVTFWSRRQANETSIHRWDAEATLGPARGFSVDVAVDALDEYFPLIVPRASVPDGGGRRIRFEAVDVDRSWIVTLDDELAISSSDDADVTVSGKASSVYLVAMNRSNPDGLSVQGERALLDVWRRHVKF